MAEFPKQPLEVSVGILLNTHQQILLTQRQNHQSYADYWEFPGGKIESGENAQGALYREISEEVGVEPTSARPLICVQHHYPEYPVRLHVFVVDQFKGTPYSKEGQNLIWKEFTRLKDFKLLPANEVILSALDTHLQIYLF